MSVGHAETAIARPARRRAPAGRGRRRRAPRARRRHAVAQPHRPAAAGRRGRPSRVDGGLGGFWDAVTAPSALAALQFTVAASAVVALVNVVVGTLIAWVLVRDEFRGKRVVDALIDLPFALPTIVASIVLLVALRTAQPGRAAPRRDQARGRHRAAVRDAAVRRALRAARADGGRPRGRAGGRVARRGQLDDLPPHRAAGARCPTLLSGARAGLRARDRRVRLGRAHRRRHPARHRGLLAVHRQADRDRPPGERRGGLDLAAAGGVRRAVRAARCWPSAACATRRRRHDRQHSLAHRAAHGGARLPVRPAARAARDDPLPDVRGRPDGVLGVRHHPGEHLGDHACR